MSAQSPIASPLQILSLSLSLGSEAFAEPFRCLFVALYKFRFVSGNQKVLWVWSSRVACPLASLRGHESTLRIAAWQLQESHTTPWTKQSRWDFQRLLQGCAWTATTCPSTGKTRQCWDSKRPHVRGIPPMFEEVNLLIQRCCTRRRCGSRSMIDAARHQRINSVARTSSLSCQIRRPFTRSETDIRVRGCGCVWRVEGANKARKRLRRSNSTCHFRWVQEWQWGPELVRWGAGRGRTWSFSAR